MKIRNSKTVQDENITRRAWLLILECFCLFSAVASSRCPFAINIATTIPTRSQKRAPMDVRALLHVQKFACAHDGTAAPESKSSLAGSRWNLTEYQGALGPITEAPMPTACPTHVARAAACPRGTCYPTHNSPSSPLASPHHDHIPIKTSPKLLLPDGERRKAFAYGGWLPATAIPSHWVLPWHQGLADETPGLRYRDEGTP